MIINYKSNDINAKTIRKKVLNFISIPPSFTKIKKATTNNQSSHGNYYNKIKPLNKQTRIKKLYLRLWVKSARILSRGGKYEL